MWRISERAGVVRQSRLDRDGERVNTPKSRDKKASGHSGDRRTPRAKPASEELDSQNEQDAYPQRLVDGNVIPPRGQAGSEVPNCSP